jgi:hypothetical protein
MEGAAIASGDEPIENEGGKIQSILLRYAIVTRYRFARQHNAENAAGGSVTATARKRKSVCRSMLFQV